MLGYKLSFRKVSRSVLAVLTIFVLVVSLESVSGSISYYLPKESGTTVSSPPVILEEGNVTGSSTIYTNSTSAKVSVAAPVWLSGWDKRVKITIDNNDFDSVLSNFPVLVYLSNSSSGRNNEDVSFVFDELQSYANRKKIAVTTNDGTQCYLEIEKWADASEQAWLWVKVPSISNTSDTDLYLYYDNDQSDNTDYVGDPNSTPAENVWDTNFKGVWHMTEVNATDSTSNDNDGTESGGVTYTDSGKIDGADDFDGTDDYVNISADLTQWLGKTASVSVWIKTTQIGNDVFWSAPGVTGVEENGGGNDVFWGWIDASGRIGIQAGDTAGANTTSAINDGNWHHIFMTRNSTSGEVRIYADGILNDTATSDTGDKTNSFYSIGRIEDTGGTPEYFNGTIDEFRISNTTRSDAWIKASYESERDDLLDFGSEHREIDYVDNNTSNVGSPTDRGTHSNFSAQQAGPDSIYDTLTEENTNGVGGTGIGTEAQISLQVYDGDDEYNPGPNVVFINDTHGYVFLQENTVHLYSSVVYYKTTNGGTSWSGPTAVSDSVQLTPRSFSCWYDQWTPNNEGTKIHLMANTYDNDITVYTYLNTSDDTSPSGWTAVSTTLGAHNSPDGGGFITVSTDGNIFGGSFAGTSGEIVKYVSNWTAITPTYLFDDDDDHAQVLPLSGGDILLLYEDSTANTLYSAVYDEATDTWGGSATSVTTITSGTTDGVEDANWGAVSDGSNNVYLVLNNDILASTGDLECWFFNDTSRSWTQKTNILTDSNGAEVKPAYDSLGDTLFAIYIVGNDVFVKNSTDFGTTWNSAQEVTTVSMGWVVIRTNFISDERIYVIYIEYSGGGNLDDAYGNTIAEMEVVTNYELDLEVQWTNADYDETNEELAIYVAKGNNTHSLDATGGYMIIGDGTPDWGSTTGTISFWIKMDTSVQGRFWGQDGNMETRWSGSNLLLDWGATGSMTSAYSFSADTWYFVAIVWDENNDNLFLYIGDENNAPTLDANSLSGTWTSTTPAPTGNRFLNGLGGNEPVDGHGDDLRYWNIARSLTEIQSDYNTELTGSETNLRSYFKLNNNFDDIGPNNNDGSGYDGYSFSSDVAFEEPPTENIRVDFWNGTAWQNLFTDLTNGWNNVSVSSYPTSSNFTIRFNGGNETGDTTQDSWYIDTTLLHVWTTETYDYVLKAVNQVADNWIVNLQVYDSSSIGRLSSLNISLHDGTSSNQIAVSGGSIVKSEGESYNLPGGLGSTIYVSMSNLQATTGGTSYLYVQLKILVPNSSTYILYVVTFEIS